MEEIWTYNSPGQEMQGTIKILHAKNEISNVQIELTSARDHADSQYSRNNLEPAWEMKIPC